MILRTLYFQWQAIPLRHLSAMSELPVFSVQNAVNLLLDEAMIKRSRKDNNVLFELNRGHSLYNVLEQFFIIEMNNRIHREARLFYQRAEEVLKFATAANVIFKHAKRKRSFK